MEAANAPVASGEAVDDRDRRSRTRGDTLGVLGTEQPQLHARRNDVAVARPDDAPGVHLVTCPVERAVGREQEPIAIVRSVDREPVEPALLDDPRRKGEERNEHRTAALADPEDRRRRPRLVPDGAAGLPERGGRSEPAEALVIRSAKLVPCAPDHGAREGSAGREIVDPYDRVRGRRKRVGGKGGDLEDSLDVTSRPGDRDDVPSGVEIVRQPDRISSGAEPPRGSRRASNEATRSRPSVGTRPSLDQRAQAGPSVSVRIAASAASAEAS